MIRGAIDYIASDRVGGWLFSEEWSTKNWTLLAFLDGDCIGAGKVEQYREDLADAGLGDGYVGFNFGIAPVEADDQVRVTVRVEGSDLILIHGDGAIANKNAVVPVASSAKSSSSIGWMLDQGWLTHDEYDYLKLLGSTGGYERSLRQPKADGAGIDAPETVAEIYLGLIAQDTISLDQSTFADVEELIAERAALIGDLAGTIVAVSASEKGEIVVTKSGVDEEEEVNETSFTVGPDRLLLLDLSADIAGDATGLTLWGVKKTGA